MNISKTQHLDLLPSPIIVLVLLIVIRFFHLPRWIWARPPPTSTSTTAPSGGCLRRYPTQTHTICSTHWSTYPKIHSRKGIDCVSCQLKISTPTTMPMKVRFTDGALIIRRPLVRRRNRAEPRRLALHPDRWATPRRGVRSMPAPRPGLGGLVVIDIPEIEDTKTEETTLDLALTLIDAIASSHRDPLHPNPRRRNPKRKKPTE